MNKTSLKIRILFAALAVIVGCSSPPQYRLLKLESGKEVKILNVMNIYFAKGEPALLLNYQTDLSINDKDTLEKEVDEIWKAFKPQVEEAGLKHAIVSAHEVPKGFILKTNSGYNFNYSKEAGEWVKHK